MGILPFANRHGRRVVCWQRLALLWAAILLAAGLPAAALSYALVGDASLAQWSIGFGAGFALYVTALGFTTPVEDLPAAR